MQAIIDQDGKIIAYCRIGETLPLPDGWKYLELIPENPSIANRQDFSIPKINLVR